MAVVADRGDLRRWAVILAADRRADDERREREHGRENSQSKRRSLPGDESATQSQEQWDRRHQSHHSEQCGAARAGDQGPPSQRADVVHDVRGQPHDSTYQASQNVMCAVCPTLGCVSRSGRPVAQRSGWLRVHASHLVTSAAAVRLAVQSAPPAWSRRHLDVGLGVLPGAQGCDFALERNDPCVSGQNQWATAFRSRAFCGA